MVVRALAAVTALLCAELSQFQTCADLPWHSYHEKRLSGLLLAYQDLRFALSTISGQASRPCCLSVCTAAATCRSGTLTASSRCQRRCCIPSNLTDSSSRRCAQPQARLASILCQLCSCYMPLATWAPALETPHCKQTAPGAADTYIWVSHRCHSRTGEVSRRGQHVWAPDDQDRVLEV